MSKDKSILDGVTVDDTRYHVGKVKPTTVGLIVGSCPKCGSPIYGPGKVAMGEKIPIQFSCECTNRNLADTMRVT